jgi:hypothetical protein
VTRPAGFALPTRLLCPCGTWTTVYQLDSGLMVRQRVLNPSRREPFAVTCHACDRTGTVDPAALRHAIAKHRRTFRIG